MTRIIFFLLIILVLIILLVKRILISENKAIKIAIEEAVRSGADREDLEKMKKMIIDETNKYYSVNIIPGSSNCNYEISMKISKITGKAFDIVSNTIAKEPDFQDIKK